MVHFSSTHNVYISIPHLTSLAPLVSLVEMRRRLHTRFNEEMLDRPSSRLSYIQPDEVQRNAGYYPVPYQWSIYGPTLSGSTVVVRRQNAIDLTYRAHNYQHRVVLASSETYPNPEILREEMQIVLHYRRTRDPDVLAPLCRRNVTVDLAIEDGSLAKRVDSICVMYHNCILFNGRFPMHFKLLQGATWSEIDRWLALGASPDRADPNVLTHSQENARTLGIPAVPEGALLDSAVYFTAITTDNHRGVIRGLIQRGVHLNRDPNHDRLKEYIQRHIDALPTRARREVHLRVSARTQQLQTILSDIAHYLATRRTAGLRV